MEQFISKPGLINNIYINTQSLERLALKQYCYQSNSWHVNVFMLTVTGTFNKFKCYHDVNLYDYFQSTSTLAL